MRRGDLVIVAVSGDFGKPRRALVIQAERFVELGSLTVLLVSGTLRDAPLVRVDVAPTPANGLRQTSQIMVDRAMTIRREKMRQAIDRLDRDTRASVDRALAVFLGFA